MFRTPANNTPAKPKTVLRRLGSKQMSSEQISALFNHSTSPLVNVYRGANKENVVSNVLKDTTRVERRSLANWNERVNALDNSTTIKVPSPDKDFKEKFCVWLQQTEQQIDSDTFAQLKSDLYALVGKYTLAKQTEKDRLKV